MHGLTLRLVSHAFGALAVLCGLVVLSPEAQAAIGVGAIDGIVSAFDNVRAFEGVLMSHAITLFWGLAVIEFTIAVGRQIIGRADVVGILATVLFQVITIGFFYWLCIHGPDMTRAIVNSFAQAASDASVSAGGSRTVSPGDIFKMGINLVKAVWDAMSLGSPVKSTLLAIAGLIVLWVFAKVAAMLLEVIVEGYFAASAATVLLGFGGSSPRCSAGSSISVTETGWGSTSGAPRRRPEKPIMRCSVPPPPPVVIRRSAEYFFSSMPWAMVSTDTISR